MDFDGAMARSTAYDRLGAMDFDGMIRAEPKLYDQLAASVSRSREHISRDTATFFYLGAAAGLCWVAWRYYSRRASLRKYGRDMTASAGETDPVIGRDDEIDHVVDILCRRNKNCVALVGAAGVGKTAIAEGLAQRIAAGTVPDALVGARVVELDVAGLVAGTKYRGTFERRMKDVIKQVEAADGEVILFIDEMHMLLGAGRCKGSRANAANMLKPALARGRIRCVGATTFDEYRHYIEKDSALERRFQKVQVEEPSAQATIAMLQGLKKRYEKHHGIEIQEAALVAAAQLAGRYITGRQFPDKAIDLIDEACVTATKKLRRIGNQEDEVNNAQSISANALKKAIVSPDHVAQVVEIQEAALVAAAQLAGRYITGRQFPDKAIDLIDQACVTATKKLRKIENQEHEVNNAQSMTANTVKKAVVSPDHVAQVVSRWTGIPVTALNQEEKDKLIHLADKLHERVVGQDEAVNLVAEAVLRSRAGLDQPGQPIGSFLFLGSTGVGKTELAKALAEQLFDSEKMLVRFDMSEYVSSGSVMRLIGAPPSYRGYEDGGQLTEQVRRHPYSVILFDEVEKADPSVFNVFLQILDDGRLTDGNGQTVDFKNTIIIMTSNLGSDILTPRMVREDTMEAARGLLMKQVQKHFKPELINRLSEIVIFKPLSRDKLKEITKIQMKSVMARVANKGISLSVSDAALDTILSESYNPMYGARPIRRWMQKNVMTMLSKMLVKGEASEGSTIRIEATDDKKGLEYEVLKRR